MPCEHWSHCTLLNRDVLKTQQCFFFFSYVLDCPHQLQKPEVQHTANGFFVFEKNITHEFSFFLFKHISV